MRKKALIVIGLLVAFFVIQGCTSKPEKTLLSRYFNAVTLNDNATLSSMALEPFQPDMISWKIVAIGEEKIEPASLPELNKAEIEAKKAQDAQIGPTLDADSALKDAQYDMETARSAAGRSAAKRKVDELQVAYDAENAKMQEFKRVYNAAKKAVADEEQITLFSLGERELPTVRELTGNVHSKEVEVAIETKAGGTKNYRLYMRQYLLRDEALGVNRRGQWKIIRFEPLS